MFLIECLISCKNQKSNKPLGETTIYYFDTFKDIGKCIEGDSIIFYVKYKNTGKNPLLINSSMGSCGCTQPHYKNSLLLPNKVDSIKVNFYSKGQVGKNINTVVVGANTEPPLTQVFFTADVRER